MKKFIISLFIIIFLPLSSFGKTNVNVAFTIDNNYPLFTLILINSILNNNWSNSDYTFWIVENNITDKNKEKMRAFVEDDKHQKIKFIHFDTYVIDKGTNFFTFSKGLITHIGMARIMLPDLLPKDVHKVLYLDSDMLATGDISALYNTDLGEYNAGMVKNIVPSDSEEIFKVGSNYFNSGMILMNLDKCREDNSIEQMLDYLNKHKDLFIYDFNNKLKPSFKYPDQDLINIVWHNKIKRLDPKWNNQSIRGASIVDPLKYGIIHYIGSNKPWHFNEWKGYMYLQIYYQNWEESPFSKYRYYYLVLRFVNNYKFMINKKIKRYKEFFKKVKNKSPESIQELFYIPSSIL